ncbi:acetyl-CoA carboxylase biotin carboxyl carrier protein subunit [Salibacter sp.]|uniref:acetyl-CoA carboxylase biotin carboxyl carrier protein subunit n=1 Tax=Salibacter sp. TaxID=2010995 RepID=UPI00287023F5|nr:acetyl-CoA carboxylase biotin carboxyl carrier protein subunit [Salibacter sp.]MDR9399668.1 acetyl-CoA carboxylase biotin carboxyl carrier protein subunit [Salibacter sp.]MDR9488672.1 acetyl-CoA carboxylase biotin carboxyl carrier protein subunit [Salibacter sp.]
MHEVKINDNSYSVDFTANDLLSGKVNDSDFELDLIQIDDTHYHLIHEGNSYNIEIVNYDSEEKAAKIKINGKVLELDIRDKFDILLDKMGLADLANQQISDVKAPMPGMVLDIQVEAGQEVKTGEPLVVLEAMKMENVIKSPTDAVIKSIDVDKGIAVEKNATLVSFDV